MCCFRTREPALYVRIQKLALVRALSSFAIYICCGKDRHPGVDATLHSNNMVHILPDSSSPRIVSAESHRVLL